MDTRLIEILDLLDAGSLETVNTSVRLPSQLRDAASLAAAMGLGASVTELTVQGLRATLEALIQRAVLDEHYRQHPDTRPTLGEVALAMAQMDGSALADHPEVVDRAAREVVGIKPHADAEDVLVYAAGMAAAA